jgi:hypothetical protein
MSPVKGLCRGAAAMIRDIGYLVNEVPKQVSTELAANIGAGLMGFDSETTKKIRDQFVSSINSGMYGNVLSVPKESYEGAAKWLESAVKTRTPDTTWGRALENTGAFIPDLIGIWMTPASKAPLLVKWGMQGMLKFPAYLGVKTYVEGAKEGKPLKEIIPQSIESTAQGIVFNGLGVWAHEIGAISRSIGAGMWTSKGAEILSNSLGFGGITAAQGGDAEQGILEGLAFSALGAPEMIKQGMQKKAMLNWMTATDNNIRMVAAQKIDPFKLRKESNDLYEKAMALPEGKQRDHLLWQKTMVDNIIDIAFMSNQILRNPDAFIKSINENPMLSAREKKVWTNKVNNTVNMVDPRIIESQPITENIKSLENELAYWNEKTDVAPDVKAAKVEALQNQIKEAKDKRIDIFSNPLEKYEPKPEKKSETAPKEEIVTEKLSIGDKSFTDKTELFKHLEEVAVSKTGQVKTAWMSAEEGKALNESTQKAISEWERSKKKTIPPKNNYRQETSEEKDARNGLFGDVKADTNGNLIKPEDQGFKVTKETLDAIALKYDERAKQLTNEIDAINKERESKIGEVLKQQTLGFEEPAKTEDTSDKFSDIRPDPNDIPLQLANNAYRNTSFNPEKRAAGEQKGYVNQVNSVIDEMSELAKSPEQEAVLKSEIERYKKGLAEETKAYLAASSRTASSMITGPSNFPVERNRKAMDVVDKRRSELFDWDKRAQESIKKAILDARTPEQYQSDKWRSIKKELDGNIETITGLDRGEIRGYNRALFVSSMKGFIDRMAKNGQVEDVKMSLDYIRKAQEGLPKPIFADRNEVWNNVKVAEDAARAKEVKGQSGVVDVAEYQGVRIVNNNDIERVQIFMDEKPSQEIISALKKEGWNWSPSNEAWQRKNTPQSVYSAKRIADKFYSPKEEVSSALKAEITLPGLSNKTIPELDNLIGQLETGMKDFLDNNETARAEKLNELIGKVIDARNEIKKEPEKPKLTFVRKVKVIEDTRTTKDQRYKVDQHIVEYRDEKGEEYRKSFNVKRGDEPTIPESGTHDELNALKDQHLLKPEISKEAPQGIKFKDKTYTEVDQVLDALDKGEITFEESKPLREQVDKFEEGLKAEAKKASDDISNRIDKGAKDIEDQIQKDINDENSKLSVKMFPDLISRGNTALWGQLKKVRDGLANAIAGQLKKGVTSQNDAIRWTTKTLTNLYAGLLRTQADMFGTGKEKQIGKLEMMGTTKTYALHRAFDLLKEWRSVVNADPESLKNVWSVLDPELATKAGEQPKTYGDLSVAEKNLYFTLKEWNTWVWSTNYANGLIPTESHLKFKGDFDTTGYSDYIARMYDAYEEGTILSPEIQEFISRGNSAITRRLNTDYMKLREETNEWKQEHAITDPAYLTAKRVMQTIQNVAIKQYMDAIIEQHPEYVVKLKKGEEVPKGFTKLGSSYSWGPLRNRAVANHIVEDFTGFYYQNAITNTVYDWVKMVDRSKLNQFYKKYRTVYNPFVQTGNVTGNVFFASINGINPFAFVKGMIDNRNLHQTNPAQYDLLLKSGLIGDVGITGEMKPLDLLSPKGDVLSKADELATKAYVGADNLAKISAYQIYRRQGLSHENAVRRAYDSFQNYATVGKTWDIASKIPLVGPTFVKFQADLQRILVNNMLTTPLTTIGTLMMVKMLGNLSSALSGETEEEQMLREGRKGVPRIPFVDIPLSFKVGKSEINVARYLSPLYLYNRGDSDMELSELSKFMPIQFQQREEGKMWPLPAFADATWGWLGSVMTDKDFRGISISDPKRTTYTDPNTPTEGKIFNVMNYIARSQIPFYKGTSDIINGATGQLDYYGRKRTWEQAILNNIINIQQFDKPELKNYVERNLNYLTSKFASLTTKMGDAQGVFYKTMKDAEDKGLSKEAQEKIYESASKLRDKSVNKSLKEQIPVYQEIERLTGVYKKWNPQDPFIQENFQNIESGKNQRFNVLDKIDLQKKHPSEYSILRKNDMLKSPEIPKFYRGKALTDEEKKTYSNIYWSEYIRILDIKDLLTQEEIDVMKERIARREVADTEEGMKEITRLQDLTANASSRAKMLAERSFRNK